MNKPQDIHQTKEWFQVLATGQHGQMAVMKLGPGQASGPEPEAHEKCDQVLLVVAGEVTGWLEGKSVPMKAGEAILIPAGAKHRFINESDAPVLTFNTYSPPEY